MSGPASELHTRLTKAEAGPPPLPGMVWSEELQNFIPLGQQFALDRATREADPAFALAQYEKRRDALLHFIGGKLQEAEYDGRGYPLKGGMHDFYLLPGYDKKTATKAGASKIADLLRLRVAKKWVTFAAFTADHGSARVAVELRDANGYPAGAHEAACSTAEAGFQSEGARRKYGAAYRDHKEVSPPDFRAAENDVIARAGKRAFVGAVIVAASLEEIFDLETSTDGASEEREERADAPATRAKPAQRDGPRMPFGDLKDTLLSEISQDQLVKVRDWCQRKGKFPNLVQQIDEELESRRGAGGLSA